MTQCLPAAEAGSLEQAIALLRQGRLVAFPTDTVYGVGALAWNEAAVTRLYEAKLRPADKAIPLLLASPAGLAEVAGEFSPLVSQLAQRYWPGPLTLVVPRSPRVPAEVTAGGETVAVRVPDHPVALRLIELLGAPLAATSANLSGQPSSRTAQEVMAQLAGRIALVLDGGPCPGGVPSTVVDATSEPLQVVRAGPIPLEEIIDFLQTATSR